jgi:hypothetical protein
VCVRKKNLFLRAWDSIIILSSAVYSPWDVICMQVEKINEDIHNHLKKRDLCDEAKESQMGRT